MPKIISITGPIIDNNTQRFYDWMGIEATSPSKVSGSLPSDKSDVDVVINSGGGDVFAGSEIYTLLKEYQGQVTVKIVGLAASAASVIAMAASEGKLMISPTAQLMMHNVSTYGGGDYRDFEHTAEILKSANQSIANAYKARTGKSYEELKAVMDKETWLNAESAVEQGFVDEIMFAEKEELSLVANFGSGMLSGDAIEKIAELMEKQTGPIQENKQSAESQFRLLKLKGVNLL